LQPFSATGSIFIPDGSSSKSALCRTTMLCIAAHPDDTEFMAYHAIAECLRNPSQWFTSCVVTDGAGSSRSGPYADFTDDEMQAIRMQEQNKAAAVGEYAAQIHLRYTSSAVKHGDPQVSKSIARVIGQCNPNVILTHDLADTHDTHVSVVLRVIEAIRMLDKALRPDQLFGLEMWRSMGWLQSRTVFDASPHPNLAAALASVHDSQIAGGKRYDQAILGRRAANATFLESHATDRMAAAIYAMDLSELIHSDEPPASFLARQIDAFKTEALQRLSHMGAV